MDIPGAALAARARVAVHEDARHGGLRVEEHSWQLRGIYESADNVPAAFVDSGWIKGCFLLSLADVLATVRQT